MNIIVQEEFKRGNVLYKPEITTEVSADGKKESKIIVKCFPNLSNPSEFNIITED